MQKKRKTAGIGAQLSIPTARVEQTKSQVDPLEKPALELGKEKEDYLQRRKSKGGKP